MSRLSIWVCPQCHTELPFEKPESPKHSPVLEVATRVVHTSASIEKYDQSCPGCGLPFTASPDDRFEYPYRQMLAGLNLHRFLRWSAAQNNGFISYAFLRGSSCAVEGRGDAAKFAEFISENVDSAMNVVTDIGCGPLPKPAYLPDFPNAVRIGIDPFESEWTGRFVQGVGEFLPLPDGSVDLVVAATSLDHALDLKRAVREIARVTRKEGCLAVWDHTFETRSKRLAGLFRTLLLRLPLKQKAARFLSRLMPERVRVYDNGIVLWSPRGYADPFHKPQSRRPSWPRKLKRIISAEGFVQTRHDPAMGFSWFVKN